MDSAILAYKKMLIESTNDSYKGEHEAPDPESGAPMHDVTANGIFPSDFYSGIGATHYCEGDHSTHSMISSVRGKPKAKVKVYRAVPLPKEQPSETVFRLEQHKRHILKTGKVPSDVTGWSDSSAYYEHATKEIERLKNVPDEEVQKPKINHGDWVTPSLAYAKEHGESNLNNRYKIISKMVNAGDVYTDGSHIEWGFHPQK